MQFLPKAFLRLQFLFWSGLFPICSQAGQARQIGPHGQIIPYGQAIPSGQVLPSGGPVAVLPATSSRPSRLFPGEGSPGRLLGRIAFYNVENFFHPLHDTGKDDRDFTPAGIKGWGNAKFTEKRNRLFKVVSALDAEVPLLALGLAEVENARVLRELCLGTPLRFQSFDFVHFESPDPRGIDVALLYRKGRLHVDTAYPIAVVIPPDTIARTRDILYVKARLEDSALNREACIIHILVSHFPSKYGGALATDHKRRRAAQVLRSALDSLSSRNKGDLVLAMGDFNTGPRDKALAELDTGAWCNLMARDEWHSDRKAGVAGGSHKYREQWSTIDHILLPLSGLSRIKGGKAFLFDRPFLLQPDDKYLGVKPFRTFYGARYLGGYSDHLPVFVDLILCQ